MCPACFQRAILVSMTKISCNQTSYLCVERETLELGGPTGLEAINVEVQPSFSFGEGLIWVKGTLSAAVLGMPAKNLKLD